MFTSSHVDGKSTCRLFKLRKNSNSLFTTLPRSQKDVGLSTIFTCEVSCGHDLHITNAYSHFGMKCLSSAVFNAGKVFKLVYAL